MPTEMGSEAVEIITMATDKFHATKNYEVRSIINDHNKRESRECQHILVR